MSVYLVPVHKVGYLRYTHFKNTHFRKETPLFEISKALIASFLNQTPTL